MSQTMCVFAITKYVFWTNVYKHTYIVMNKWLMPMNTQRIHARSIACSLIHSCIHRHRHSHTQREICCFSNYLFDFRITSNNMYIQLYNTRHILNSQTHTLTLAKFILLDKIWYLFYVYMQRGLHAETDEYAESNILNV